MCIRDSRPVLAPDPEQCLREVGGDDPDIRRAVHIEPVDQHLRFDQSGVPGGRGEEEGRRVGADAARDLPDTGIEGPSEGTVHTAPHRQRVLERGVVALGRCLPQHGGEDELQMAVAVEVVRMDRVRRRPG